MDIVKFKSGNDGYTYITINVYYWYMRIMPLKDKKGTSVVVALRGFIFEDRQPSRVGSAKCQEFKSKEVNNMFGWIWN